MSRPIARTLVPALILCAAGCARHPQPSATPSPATTLVAAVQPSTDPAPTATPTAVPMPAITAQPPVSVTPAPAAPSTSAPFLSPLLAPTLAPVAPIGITFLPVKPAPVVLRVSTPAPVVPQLPPDAAPQILAVQLPSSVVTGGQTVVGSVVTSSNVASVEVRVAGYSRSMQKTGTGQFAIAVTVPRLPFFLRHRTYTLRIVARNTRGDAVEQTVPITVR